MLEVYLTIFFISVLLIFLGSGVWVGISMIGVSTIGMMMFTSRPVGDAMATTMWSMGSSWSLTALPQFLLALYLCLRYLFLYYRILYIYY